MRPVTVSLSILMFVCLAMRPLAAQTRPARSGGNEGAGDARATAAPRLAVPSYNSATPYAGYSGSSYSADPVVNRAFNPAGNPGGSLVSSPNLQGTSFNSYSLYDRWNDYYLYLNRYYSLNSTYFTRFYTNREPLVTPAMLRLTLRQPVYSTAQMLRLIDELEIMYRESLAGKDISKEALIDKAQSIRKLAKGIRGNRTIALIDLRKKTDVFDEKEFNALSLESVAKLREMALDLKRQLSGMIAVSSSSTISVQNYREPSFESISKGIEKACKVIENSSKRL